MVHLLEVHGYVLSLKAFLIFDKTDYKFSADEYQAEGQIEVKLRAEDGPVSSLLLGRHTATVWDGAEWIQKQSLPNTEITLPPPLPYSSLTLNSASTYFLNPLSVLLYSSSVAVVWSSSRYELWWVLWNLRSPCLKVGYIYPMPTF